METPFHGWSPILALVLGLDPPTPPAERRARVSAQLPTQAQGMEPLVNAALGLDFPETALTCQMAGQLRADNALELLVGLVATRLRGPAGGPPRPLLIVLEDSHWLDASSWALAARLSRALPAVLLVLTSLPRDGTAEVALLLERPGSMRLELAALSPADGLRLACQRLGVSALPDAAARLIAERAEGNPYFIEELACALRDAGALVVADGEARLGGDLRALRFPDTLAGVVTSRIDRLGAQEQLTLKVGSCIGRSFVARVLVSVHPVAADRARVPEHLDHITRLQMLAREPATSGEAAYLFRHGLTHEVAYNLMLFAQRRQLHRAIAGWYEAAHAGELAPHYALLAHHFGLAAEPARALEYLDLAAEQALRAGAFAEARVLLERAIATDAELGEAAGDSRARRDHRWQQARRQRQLGEAHHGLGALGPTAEQMGKSLRLIGRPLPRTGLGWGLALGSETLRQLWHRLLGGRVVSRAANTRRDLREAAQALQLVSEGLYFARRPLPMLVTTLRALNLADRVGPAPTLAHAGAFLGAIFGIFGRRGLARRAFARAEAFAVAANDLVGQAYVDQARALTAIGRGDWPAFDSALAAAVAIYRRLADRTRGELCATLDGLALYYRGRFAEAHAVFAVIREAAVAAGNAQHEIWGLYALAEVLLPLGRASEALSLLERAVSLLDRHPDHPSELITYGLLGVARLRLGDQAAASRAASTCLERISAESPTVFSTLEGYAGAAEVFLAVGDRARAARACQRLAAFAARFPIGQPRALLMRGRQHPGRARALWLRGLARAEQLGMPYERGLLLGALGERQAARIVFSELGCTADEERGA
jgi:tetratricopeptide (TPR) repeat protein